MGTNSLRLIASAALIAPLHAQTSYGTGSPGAGGVVPTLSSNQPWLGNTGFTLSVDQAVGGSFGFVLLSTGPTAGFVGTIPLWIDLAQQFASLSFITDGAPGAPGAGSGSPSPWPPTRCWRASPSTRRPCWPTSPRAPPP